MWAFVFALATLMWMWTAISLYLVRWLGGRAEASVQLAYLGVLIAAGAVGLLLLPYLVLPASFLSQGWTRDLLENTQQITVLLISVVAASGFMRTQALLAPSVTLRVAKPLPIKPGQKKRQP